ncbi:DEAD-box ATP-dependent RNA helicase 17 [Glycine max]|nr:DEAD-box ATP-dependent RNA helicase 17 [Glycine max]
MQRQNLLLSTTLNERVNHLAKMSLDNPVMIGLDESDEDSEDKYYSKVPTVGDYKVPLQLIQRYMKVPCGSRLPVLLSILKHLFEREPSQKVVLFFSTCDAVDFHYSLLSEFQFSSYSQTEGVQQVFLGCKTFRLHGNMQQEDRRTSFQAFKTEKSALLLSTDVSARGLDFPKVRFIIQYDSPGEATEYVHRVGRTARLGERGESLVFLQPVEIDYLQDLEKHGVSLTEYPVLKVLDNFPLQKNHTKKSVFLESHPWVLCLQKALEAFIMSKPEMDELSRKAFCSWVRAYTAHRGELKRVFMIKKLHLGHVAKSFALKQPPSLVGQSFQKQIEKRKIFEKKNGLSKKRKVAGL